jgi:hypothetical protein
MPPRVASSVLCQIRGSYRSGKRSRHYNTGPDDNRRMQNKREGCGVTRPSCRAWAPISISRYARTPLLPLPVLQPLTTSSQHFRPFSCTFLPFNNNLKKLCHHHVRNQCSKAPSTSVGSQSAQPAPAGPQRRVQAAASPPQLCGRWK